MSSQSTGINILAKILQEGRQQAFANLDRKYFFEHEIILYDFIESHIKEFGVLPSGGLAEEKTDLVNIPREDVYGYYHQQWSDKAMYNQLTSDSVIINRLLAEGKVHEALAKMTLSTSIASGIKRDNEGDIVSLGDMGESVLDFVRGARSRSGLTGIPSPWASLDAETNGWQKGDLYVIVARPKMGKSHIMSLLGVHAHSVGYIPMWVSMEMKLLQVGRRLFAEKAKIDMNCMKSGTISTFAEIELMKQIKLAREAQPMYFVEGQFKKDIGDLSSLVYGQKPDILFIDGGYLVKLLRSQNVAKWERLTEIAESMKTLAMKANIPVVVSFQFNREQTKAKGGTGFEHIQLADAIGQLASVGIGIFEQAPEEEGRIENISQSSRFLEVIGGREGEEAGFNINWDWKRMNFSEIITTGGF